MMINSPVINNLDDEVEQKTYDLEIAATNLIAVIEDRLMEFKAKIRKMEEEIETLRELNDTKSRLIKNYEYELNILRVQNVN